MRGWPQEMSVYTQKDPIALENKIYMFSDPLKISNF